MKRMTQVMFNRKPNVFKSAQKPASLSRMLVARAEANTEFVLWRSPTLAKRHQGIVASFRSTSWILGMKESH
jgi:hypothetical protein